MKDIKERTVELLSTVINCDTSCTRIADIQTHLVKRARVAPPREAQLAADLRPLPAVVPVPASEAAVVEEEAALAVAVEVDAAPDGLGPVGGRGGKGGPGGPGAGVDVQHLAGGQFQLREILFCKSNVNGCSTVLVKKVKSWNGYTATQSGMISAGRNVIEVYSLVLRVTIIVHSTWYYYRNFWRSCLLPDASAGHPIASVSLRTRKKCGSILHAQWLANQ